MLITPTLPSVQSLREVRLQVPLSVFSAEGRLIAQFGETRRYPVAIADIPPLVKQAFIAAEDAEFYEHSGISPSGIARAGWLLLTSGNRRVPGGSTITQQVARSFFLSSEYSFSRKLTEIFLALKMERELGKDEILDLYLNKSFFGNRAYGVAAAAEFYYGKHLDELSLEEAAMLASIVKFPSSGNPVVNPARALLRRNYVLRRMFEENFIDEAQLQAALAQPDRAHPHEPPTELDAPWLAEMVRLEVIQRFGENALNDGLRVFTTVDARAQEAANLATRSAVLDYDRRHGWRGAEAHVELRGDETPAQWQEHLRNYRPVSGLLPALVIESAGASAQLALADGQTVDLPLERMAWARPFLDTDRRGAAPQRTQDALSRGDIVRLQRDADGEWTLAQLPKVQGALVAVDWENGAIRAMTGGFSFGLNKFNRVTQAQRLPGSSFKPFIYAAAFERGFTPASIVLDAPLVLNDRASGKVWSPQNDNERFAGPMRLREAMVTSRNLVSVRVLDAIGVSYARRFVQAFGFAPESLPENLSLALGTAAAPPLAMVRGYAAFANGGYLIEPYFIERIEDRDGQVLFQASPKRACAQCPERKPAGTEAGHDSFDLGAIRTASATETAPVASAAAEAGHLAPQALDPRTAYLVHSLLQDVVRRGTGRLALELGRRDVGGKTGTTNEHRDGWFSGFGGPLVATAWMGMDDFTSLGNGEFASKTALPIWVSFMKAALDGQPEHLPVLPPGITTALIDKETGRLAGPNATDIISETFKVEDLTRLEQHQQTQEVVSDKESFDIF